MKNETELLQECKLQLEYLNEKFGETGTTNALLTKLDAVLRQPIVISSVCDCEAHTFYEWEKDENKCSQCNKRIYKQTDL